MSQPPMMLNSTLPGVVLPLSGPDASPSPASASYPRPRAETTGYLSTLSMSEARLSDTAYQTAYYSRSSPSLVPHSRNSSNASTTASSFSLPSASSPADSPQSATSANIPPGFKSAPAVTRTTIRRARTGTSPYPRELHIHSNSDLYSSSSEAEDMHMYSSPYAHPPSHHAAAHGLHHHDPYASGSLYNMHPSVGHIDPMQSIQHHQLHQQQQPQQAPGAPPSQYGGARAGMHSTDHNLEQLASNVRSATTTSASDRAKQIFVHAWLNANYTPYADGNVPRQGLYSSYRRVCDQYGIPHMNTATLGKAIRLCFPAIKTRRLGVRGNSKYHYCGIRPSNTTEAEWLQDYIRKTNTAGNNNAGGEPGLDRANSHSSRGSGAGGGDSDEDDEGDSPDGPHSGNASKRSSLNLDSLKHTGVLPPSLDDKTPTTSSVLAAAQNVAPTSMLGSSSNAALQSASVRRRSAQPEFAGMQVPTPTSVGQQSPFTPQQPVPPQLGQPTYSIRHLPSFPKIEEALGNAGSSPQGVAAREVWRWFEDHLDALLESTRALRFDQFELHLRTFWASLTGDHREVVHAPAVAGLMAKADALLYDEILETLRSQILAPIPTPALASLRGLADQMEKVLLLALENYGSTFVEPKVELGARFGHLVLRFLDIYQVTQALATVLQNPKQLADMRRAWSEIDFESVRNQSALVCNCRHEDLIQLLEGDFVVLLDGLQRSAEPVRDVMLWADECCERLMGSNRAEDRSTLSSRSVLIRWGYVTSQIMRDLTIRSDPAFGAFQILKLFLDDWIALNVLRAVALSTNSVAASVEPVIQQQFFTMSPPEFGAGPGGMAPGNPLMDHSQNQSLMGALNDSPFAQPDTTFSSSLDGSTSSYAGASAFGSLDGMNFMDHHSAHGGPGGMVGIGGGDPLLAGSGVGDMTFGDPSSGFDVGSFASEFVMSSTNTPADSGDSGPSKHESPTRPSSS